MSRNPRRNHKQKQQQHKLGSPEQAITVEAGMDAIAASRGLSWSMLMPDEGAYVLRIFHDDHAHEEKRTIPRTMRVADLLVVLDELCTAWHTKAPKH
jgi:hypothetical protein